MKAPAKWHNFIIPFGKHKGDTIKSVIANDEQYMQWACHNEVSWFMTRMPEKKIKKFAKRFSKGGSPKRYTNSYDGPNDYSQRDYDEDDYAIGAYDLCVDGW